MMMGRIGFILMFIVIGWALYAQPITFSKRVDIDNMPDIGFAVLEVDDGYVAWVGGRSSLFGTYYGAHLIKYDLMGNVTWIKSIGETGISYGVGYGKSLQKYKEGYVGCGFWGDTIQGDAYIVRFNDMGDTLWLRSYGGNYNDAFYNCVILPDGRIAASGFTRSFSANQNQDFYLVVVDSNGTLLSEKNYGGSDRDISTNIDTTSDGGLIMGGATYSKGIGSQDNWLVKTDSLWNIDWDTTYGTTGLDGGVEVRSSRFGGYYIWGHMDTLPPYVADVTAYVGKIDDRGRILWRRFFSKVTEQFIWDFEELPSGDITFLGIKHTYDYGPEEGWLVKLDSDGNVLWERMHKYLEHPNSDNYYMSSWFRGFRPTSDGGFIVTGMCTVGLNDVDTTGQDVWLLKLDSMGCLIPGCDTIVDGLNDVSLSSNDSHITVFPNPTHTTATVVINQGAPNSEVSFTLYNLTGQQVHAHTHQLNTYGYGEWQIDCSGFSPGMYLYQITSEKGIVGKGKLVVE